MEAQEAYKCKHILCLCQADASNILVIRAPSANLAEALEETEVGPSMDEHEADKNNIPIIRTLSADFSEKPEETEAPTSTAKHTSNNPVVRSPSAHFAETLKETEVRTYVHGRNVHTGPVSYNLTVVDLSCSVIKLLPMKLHPK